MKKTTILSIILFALLASSCASRQINPTILRLAENPLLVARYLNVDTASFRELEHVRNINMMVNRDFELSLEERQPNNRRLRNRHRINSVEQAIQWLERYSTTYFMPGGYKLSHYKQVEDGFLLKGLLNSFNELLPASSNCHRMIRWVVLLVGHDHQITEIKRWEINPCPIMPTYYIDVTVHYPEFENADIRFPELIDSTIYNHLTENLRYPPFALELTIEGSVKVSFTVEVDGSMSNIEIIQDVQDVGPASFVSEVLRCLMMIDGREFQWQGAYPNRYIVLMEENQKFQWIPGMKNGEKIPMQVMVEVDFYFDLAGHSHFRPRRIALVGVRYPENPFEPIIRPNRITRIVQRIFSPGRN